MNKNFLDTLFGGGGWKCGVCGTLQSVGCQCWEQCPCGWHKRRGEAHCGNEYCDGLPQCVCEKRGESRQVCADARSLKGPCRCDCHHGRHRR